MSEEIRIIRFADTIKDREFMDRLSDPKHASVFRNADRISEKSPAVTSASPSPPSYP